ncbi:MAG: helix-turn-helix domain-containing protein, partial [Thermoflexibacter sp.]|nr:helix-turn-helix domain-containing protein [Thermoflexibacter sp.]
NTNVIKITNYSYFFNYSIISNPTIITDRIAISNKVKAARKEKHYHQKEVAGHLGVSQANYSQMENGIISINVEQIAKLATYLGKEINYFFSDDSTPPHTNLFLINSLKINLLPLKELTLCLRVTPSPSTPKPRRWTAVPPASAWSPSTTARRTV